MNRLIARINQNPYYFYNLNPAFKLGLVDSPILYVSNKKPIFSLQIPEHQLKQQFVPSNVFYVHSNHPLSPRPASLHSTTNHLRPLDRTISSTSISALSSQTINPLAVNLLTQSNQHQSNLNNQLFNNRVGSINEHGLVDNHSDEPVNHQQTGYWCNKQMQRLLQPYCFCGKNRLTKNSLICSNVPSEIALRRTLHSAAILLNVEGIYRISKLRIFNSTIDDLNSQTLPETLQFMLIQMNKCGLASFDHLNVLHGSAQLKIDLNLNELEEFPFDELYQLSALLILKLSHNHLRSLPDDALRGCHKLKVLDLSFNQLSYLGNHAFRGALNLKFLDLRFNRIKVLNNYALAFHPSSVLYLIDLSNNYMRFIGENAFDNLIAHKLYLNSNRLKKFSQDLFEPILNNMVKINIEQKLLHSNRHSTSNAFDSFGNEEEIRYRNQFLPDKEDKQMACNKTIDNQIEYRNQFLQDKEDKQMTGNKTMDNQTKYNQTLMRNQTSGYVYLDKKDMGNSTSKNETLNTAPVQNLNETLVSNSSIEDSLYILKNYHKELDILTKLNLSDQSLNYLADDLIFNELFDKFDQFSHFNEFLQKLEPNLRSVDEEHDRLFAISLFTYLSSFSNLSKDLAPNSSLDQLDRSDSFREEIKTNSTVFFDDETEHRNEFSNFDQNVVQSSNLNSQDDDMGASIYVSDNNFQCTCDGFEWLFRLNNDQLRTLKGFQCSNLPGQKKFSSLDHLTPADFNCWDY